MDPVIHGFLLVLDVGTPHGSFEILLNSDE